MDSKNRDFVTGDARLRLYRPISETEYRVIHLLPGGFHDEIHCVLETRSFQVKTRYEALSYQWGDESSTKPIQMALLTHQPKSLGTASPERATGFLAKIHRFLQATAKRYKLHLRCLTWFLATCFLWSRLMPSWSESRSWISLFIPQDSYIAFFCILSGATLQYHLIAAIKLMIEIAETKPWRLASNFHISHSEQQRTERPLEFETLRMTSSLDLALRHLRREKSARTLWIDALCINQENEDEKGIQIQRMQWIYANASPIVVWLGGYHGLVEDDTCAKSSLPEGVDCEHRSDIQRAFDYIWTRSSWRRLFSLYFDRNEKNTFRKSRSGFCDIARRGWWERLWVIQEIALATGRIQLQCGHNTCDFEDFASAQYSILSDYAEDEALQHDFRSCSNFRATIKDFRYSSFHDREGLSTKIFRTFMIKATNMFFRDISDDVVRFHELPLAHKLYRVLLRTAGRFKCHDDRDRLHAVLGIVGGATMGTVTRMANFMENVSSTSTQMILAGNLDHVTKTTSPLINAAIIAITIIYASWGVFYDSTAKHWTMNRPDYLVADYEEVIEAVASRPGEQANRSKLFAAIARYLAEQTGSLAFLDVATCGEDEDMPSWVPDWTRELSEPAYDFTSRIIQKDLAQGLFRFIDGGKTLQLAGISKGRVKVIQPEHLDFLDSSPWHGAFEKVLALPDQAKRVVPCVLQLIGLLMDQRSINLLTAAEKKLILQSFTLMKALLKWRSALLRAGGTTMVYSYDMKAREMGYLRAGEAKRGDRLVFVPGCFHHLLLRCRKQTKENPVRWKLVGLVAMPMTAAEKRGYSRSDWAQLLKEGAVHKYSIE